MGTLNQLTLRNQYGEVFICEVESISVIPLPAQAAGTFVGNVTGGSAVPVAVSAAATATALPAADITAKALTGFVSGAGTVAAADTILQGFNKISGNTQNRAVTANLLTGLAAGADSTILATDTILEALAKLQAQINSP